MIRCFFLCVCFMGLRMALAAHQPERRLYEDLPSKVYATSGKILLDHKTGYCYRQFFVPMAEGRYEKHYLPIHCEERMLTVGHPEVRVKQWIPAPTPPSGMPFHHRIKRTLADGSLEFSKNIVKAGFELGKNLGGVLLRVSQGVEKRFSHKYEIYSSLYGNQGYHQHTKH
jgi:hypothetical protein